MYPEGLSDTNIQGARGTILAKYNSYIVERDGHELMPNICQLLFQENIVLT